jgi:hypothetical protein
MSIKSKGEINMKYFEREIYISETRVEKVALNQDFIDFIVNELPNYNEKVRTDLIDQNFLEYACMFDGEDSLLTLEQENYYLRIEDNLRDIIDKYMSKFVISTELDDINVCDEKIIEE